MTILVQRVIRRVPGVPMTVDDLLTFKKAVKALRATKIRELDEVPAP
jgi:hypothetical protein